MTENNRGASPSEAATNETHDHSCHVTENGLPTEPCDACEIERQLPGLPLREWVQQRYDNCMRVARLKDGEDAPGWYEDAHYFRLLMAILDGLARTSSSGQGSTPNILSSKQK